MTVTYKYIIQEPNGTDTGDNGLIATVSYAGNVYDQAGNKLSVNNTSLGGNEIIADTIKPVIKYQYSATETVNPDIDHETGSNSSKEGSCKESGRGSSKERS